MFQTYLQANGRVIYSCAQCRAHLAVHDELISTAFHGRTGRAFLFNSVQNLTHGPSDQRMLSTGLHTVCDTYCICCHTNVGWYYEAAFEERQKYKEGKFILEKALITKE